VCAARYRTTILGYIVSSLRWASGLGRRLPITTTAVLTTATTATPRCSLLGDQYGLSAPRYAFTNGSAVVVGFVHPQNLLASWSGGRTAAGYAGIVDTYARRLYFLGECRVLRQRQEQPDEAAAADDMDVDTGMGASASNKPVTPS